MEIIKLLFKFNIIISCKQYLKYNNLALENTMFTTAKDVV